MQKYIVKVWRGEAPYSATALFVPLFVLSLIYRVCLETREILYRKGILKVRRASIPVISVGNITLGGTGKTPIVELLSRRLRERGLNPGIVLRGYKRERKGTFRVNGRTDTAGGVGDEAFMLSRKSEIPVIVGTERIKAIEKGVEECGIDIALLDDGYQVRNVRKDVELLVLNGSEASRRGDLFPLGPYREPIERMLRADALLVSKGEPREAVPAFAGHIPVFRVQFKPLHLYNVKHNLMAHYNFMQGKRVLAFSALGDNRSFFSLLKDLQALVVHEIAFPDHHAYTEADMKRIVSHKGIDLLITTEKDAVKIAHLHIPDNLFYLAIEAAIEREEELIDRMLNKVKEA